MRLVKISSSGELSLMPDLHDNLPPYAILSHTWGADDEEVTFADMQRDGGKSKVGYAKLGFSRTQSLKHGLEYFWIDTCCINKDSATELSEALNSMFRWYENAARCYVYLADVGSRKRALDGEGSATWEAAFRQSRWFTRGWTLQELLAPKILDFFSREGDYLGSKSTLIDLICDITGISVTALLGAPLSSFFVDTRLSWVAARHTKRVEDRAYCLLGILGVYIAPIYGEGDHAWTRLMKEVDSHASLDPHLSAKPAPTIFRNPAEYRAGVMASLKFTQMESRRVNIQTALSATCRWFLKHPTYTTWQEQPTTSQNRGFLWIKGKPGAGKSTLMKFIHASAEEQERDANDAIVISFFFNARGEDLEKSTVGLYRSLLFQLLKKVPALQKLLDSVSTALKDPSRAVTWTVEKLQYLLREAISQSEMLRIRCFIDALDECDEQQIREMVLFWEDVLECTGPAGHDLYVCFASRHYPTIDIHNGPEVILELEDEHKEDVAKYVQKHLRCGRDKRFDEIRKEIVKLANGVFIWAVLVVEILNSDIRRGRDYAILKRLREIPPRLSDLFKEMMTRDADNTEDMLLCLRLILFAKRPLTPTEFYLAMIAGLDPQPEYLAACHPRYFSTQILTNRVHDSSKGFAEITTDPRPVVQLIHESVRDFLIKDNGLSALLPPSAGPLQSSSHDQLKQCCLEYLKTSWHQPGFTDSYGSYPFLDYAANSVLYHANEAAKEIDQLAFLKELDLKVLIDTLDMVKPGAASGYSSAASLVYILADRSAARLIETARKHGWDDCVYGEHRQYPLFAALANGDEVTVLALLGFDDHEDSSTTIQPLGFSELSFSHSPCSDGHPQRRLSGPTRARLSLQDPDGRNTLSWAAERGFEKVTKMLLAVGQMDDGSEDKNGRRPLSYAAANTKLVILEILLGSGADVNAKDHLGQTALHWTRNLLALQLLTAHGAKVNARQTNGTTALHHLWGDRDLPLAQYLIQKGADVEAADEDGHTPLHHWAFSGPAKSIDLLLKNHASLAATDRYGMTAFLWAVASGRKIAVEELLSAGADLHRIDVYGNTALMHSVRDYELTALMLDHGFSVDTPNEDGMTMLMYASRLAPEGITDEVPRRSTNIDFQDKNGFTALLHASASGNRESVRTLLRNGASVDVADHHGNTALMLALDLSETWIEPRIQRVIKTRKLTALEDYQLQLKMLEQQNRERLSNARMERGVTSTVSRETRLSIMDLLLGHGIDANASRYDGKTAIMLATEAQLDGAVLLLQEHSKIFT